MSQQKAKPQSVLHGYSERGVVNALFEEMVSRGDLKLFSKLFRCLISWTEARVYEPPVFDKVEVYIEHSLSDFGSPDVVLVLKSEERVVEVFFIEAKRETFAKTTQALDRPSHRKIRYTKNCSSILHELFLKWAYFAWIRGRLKTVGGNNDRVRVYTGTEKAAGRYIGKDPVVLDFHSLLGPFLQEHEPIFVTMTTDQIDGNGSPVDQAVVLRRTEAIFDQNRHSTHKGSFLSNLYLLPWLSVVQFAQGKNVHLDRFVREITRNQSKFHPPVIP